MSNSIKNAIESAARMQEAHSDQHIDNPNFGKDNHQEDEMNQNEAEYRRDTDAGVEALATETPRKTAATTGYQRPPKTPAELKEETAQCKAEFALMSTPATHEQHETLAVALYNIFQVVDQVTSADRAQYLLGDLAFSAQRNFVSARRWIERGSEWMDRIATSAYADAEDRMDKATDSFNNNMEQLSSAVMLLNALLDVWGQVADPEAVPILRDWRVIVGSVENAEQKGQANKNSGKTVKSEQMKAALAARDLQLKALGIVPKSEQ